MILKSGLQELVIRESAVGAGTISRELSVQSDAALFLVWVSSVTGVISIEVFGLLDSGKEVSVLTFPPVSNPTTELLQQRTGTVPTRLRLVVTHTGACDIEISARAVSTGSSDTRILGGASLKMGQKAVTATPSILIPASLNDRAALAIKNWSTSGIVYLAETAAKANASTGWPIGPKDALGIDIQAGVEIYAAAVDGPCDVRIIESGG